ncbi:YfiR family protein [Skermanella mucosa]|uniref:YfiR family protein n=1 Tax=Skermanella mucosa TaxID=1789672 RepID=UPI00192B7588|nr:YfiR family protein [Skermanella mucosa]UEM23663.1 YfiR family protein [Skermanella mucosa]
MPRRSFLDLTLKTVAILALMLSAGGLVSEVSAAPSEYEVKAAFLYNFAKFTDWPSAQNAGPGPFTICILGKDPFGTALDVLEGKPVDGRPVAIRRMMEPGDLQRCWIMFVGHPYADGMERLAGDLQGQPILTVGDNPGFVRSGGMIGFILDDGRIRFEIDPDRISPAGLSISSQLLNLAVIVRSKESSGW